MVPLLLSSSQPHSKSRSVRSVQTCRRALRTSHVHKAASTELAGLVPDGAFGASAGSADLTTCAESVCAAAGPPVMAWAPAECLGKEVYRHYVAMQHEIESMRMCQQAIAQQYSTEPHFSPRRPLAALNVNTDLGDLPGATTAYDDSWDAFEWSVGEVLPDTPRSKILGTRRRNFAKTIETVPKTTKQRIRETPKQATLAGHCRKDSPMKRRPKTMAKRRHNSVSSPKKVPFTYVIRRRSVNEVHSEPRPRRLSQELKFEPLSRTPKYARSSKYRRDFEDNDTDFEPKNLANLSENFCDQPVFEDVQRQHA